MTIFLSHNSKTEGEIVLDYKQVRTYGGGPVGLFFLYTLFNVGK